MKLIAWLLLAATAAAAEPVKLPLDVGTLKTRDGKVYEGAKVTGNDAVGVKITHAGGVARVEYARLPKDLAAKFPRDREAAKEQLEKEAKDEAAHDRAVDKALVTKKTPVEEPKGGTPDATANDLNGTGQLDEAAGADEVPIEGKPELNGNAEAKIATLNAYISRLEAGIDKANARVLDARSKAERYQATATVDTRVSRMTANGMSTTGGFVDNKSRMRRADFQNKRAAREEAKISQAQFLIEDAKAQISTLQSQIKE